MTKSEVLQLYNNLNQLGKLSGVKFSYAVARNLALLKPEVEAINKTLEPSKEFLEWDKERVALAQEYSKKDEKGEPVIVGNRYVMENEKTFNKELEKKQKNHKSAIDAREKQIEEYMKLLEEKSEEIKLFKVKLEHIPEAITTQQMNGIVDIVEE